MEKARKSNNKKCIGIDWLTISGRIPLDVVITELNYIDLDVVKTTMRTEHFSEVYKVIFDKEAFGYLLMTPMSIRENGGIFEKDACQFKLENSELYRIDWFERFALVTQLLNITRIKLSRLDLFVDFNLFDNGLDVKTFFDKIVSSQIRRIGKGKFAINGLLSADFKRAMNFQYIRWSSPKSKIKTYLYNKSEELLEVKDKPYIREMWAVKGLDPLSVYRLEFSMTGGSFLWSTDQERIDDVELNESIPLSIKYKKREYDVKGEMNIGTLQNHHKVAMSIQSLIKSHFDVRFNDDSNISRCTRLNLLTVFHSDIVRLKIVFPTNVSRAKRKMMDKFKDMALECGIEGLPLKCAMDVIYNHYEPNIVSSNFNIVDYD